MAIFRTAFAMLMCVLELVLLSPLMLLEKARKNSGDPVRLAKREESVNRVVKWWAKTILFYSGVKVTVTGLENIPDEPKVFVGNHQGYYDIITLLGAMDKCRPFMGQIAFKKVPFLSGWMQNLDCVFVNRENPREAMKSIKEAEVLLHSGKDIYVFPEGTRSRCDKIAPFKQGAFRMATNARTPIVPFFIDGTWKIFEANGVLIKPGHVNITILPPIITEGMEKSRLNALTDEVYGIIAAEQRRQKGWPESDASEDAENTTEKEKAEEQKYE